MLKKRKSYHKPRNARASQGPFSHLCQMCGKRLLKAKLHTRAKFCSTFCRRRWHGIHVRWRQWLALNGNNNHDHETKTNPKNQ